MAGHMAQGRRLRAIAWVRAGDRLGESDAPAMRKLERRRSARALPAVPLTCHAWHVDGRHGWRGSMSCTMCRVAPIIICAADPHFFSASKFHELLTFANNT